MAKHSHHQPAPAPARQADPRPLKVDWDTETLELIDFGDITPWSRKIKIGNDIFIVREASAEAGTKFRNKGAQAARFNDQGKVLGVDNPADSEVYLVHLCLFYNRPDPKNPQGGEVEANVPLDRVKSWKYSVVKQLFDRIALVSGLKQEEEDEVFLQKRIAEDQKKLEQLRNGSKEEPTPPSHGNDAKNLPGSSTDTSS